VIRYAYFEQTFSPLLPGNLVSFHFQRRKLGNMEVPSPKKIPLRPPGRASGPAGAGRKKVEKGCKRRSTSADRYVRALQSKVHANHHSRQPNPLGFFINC
jgi:hypothetical protein